MIYPLPPPPTREELIQKAKAFINLKDETEGIDWTEQPNELAEAFVYFHESLTAQSEIPTGIQPLTEEQIVGWWQGNHYHTMSDMLIAFQRHLFGKEIPTGQPKEEKSCKTCKYLVNTKETYQCGLLRGTCNNCNHWEPKQQPEIGERSCTKCIYTGGSEHCIGCGFLLVNFNPSNK